MRIEEVTAGSKDGVAGWIETQRARESVWCMVWRVEPGDVGGEWRVCRVCRVGVEERAVVGAWRAETKWTIA